MNEHLRKTIEKENEFIERMEKKLTPYLWAIILGIIAIYAFPARAADSTLIFNIVQCESSWIHKYKSGRLRCGDDGVSCGIAQFRKDTFYEFAKMARKEHLWHFGKPKYDNERQQMFLLIWGVDHGYGRRWTCYRKITADPMD
jgi:hypothetical protein